MKIGTIKITNFLSFKDAEFDFSNKGLVLLNGLNKDNVERSNGSGKSSIIDALVWGMFGETTKKIKADEVINRDEFSDCSVVLNLSEEDVEYRIERYRQHIKYKNDVRFFIDDFEFKGKNATETQQIINDHLGVDFKIFTNSVLFPQESKFKFVTANDNEKKEILTDILNLKYIDEAKERTKEIIKKIELDINGLETKLESHLLRISELEDEVSDAKNRVDEFERSRRVELDELDKQFVKLNRSIDEARDSFAATTQKHDDFESKRSKNMSELEKEIEELENRAYAVVDDVEKKRDDVAKLKGKLKVIEDLKKKRDKLNKEAAGYNIDADIRKKKITRLREEIEENDAECLKFEEMGEGECPTCMQNVCDEHISKIKSEYCAKNESVEALIKEKAKERKRYIKKASDVLEKVGEFDELILKQDAIDSKIEELQELIDHSEEIRLKKEKVAYQIESKREILDSKRQEENPHSPDPLLLEKTIVLTKEEIVNTKEKITKKTDEKNPYGVMSSLNVDKIKKIAKKSKDVNKLIEEKKEKLLYCEFWEDGFSNKGMKSFIFDAIVNDLNDKISDYITEMFDGTLEVALSTESQTATGDVRQKISLNVTYDGQEVSFDSLSGGEKRTISLATDLALSSLISERQFKKFNLLIMDEATDNLDMIGQEKFLDLLQTLNKETTLVISHDEVFKNKFDNVIIIEKKNGESVIIE